MDEENNPLPGPTVYFDGTTTGVITDLGGYFNLEVQSYLSKPTLVITYLGYNSVYIKDLAKLKSRYQLEPKAQTLDKVTVFTSVFKREEMEDVF